jgi:hypothetical protein
MNDTTENLDPKVVRDLINNKLWELVVDEKADKVYFRAVGEKPLTQVHPPCVEVVVVLN